MTDDDAMMSVDFITGFTIFLIVFIWVAAMVPGLFIGLKSHTVDYDAVAYRTSVILVEDPGAAGTSVTGPWEIQEDKRDIARFGLARSKETPNILDERKVNRFFCSTAFSYPDDYRPRVIFGDYQYRFNISLRETGEDRIWSVGDVLPAGYGYIRRDVKIRHGSHALINESIIKVRGYNNTEDVQGSEFVIQFDNKALLEGDVTNPAYQIDYRTDRIIINITDINVTRFDPYPVPGAEESKLAAIHFYQRPYAGTSLASWPPLKKYENFTFIDENSSATLLPPSFTVRNNVSLIFEPGFFATMDPTATMFINLTFELTPAKQHYFNNTRTAPFDYNYMASNVTQPYLKDAVLEVAVW